MSILEDIKEEIDTVYFKNASNYKLINIVQNPDTTSERLEKISLLKNLDYAVFGGILKHQNANERTLFGVLTRIRNKQTVIDLLNRRPQIGLDFLWNENLTESLISKFCIIFNEMINADGELLLRILSHEKFPQDLIPQMFQDAKKYVNKARILLSPTVGLEFFLHNASTVFKHPGKLYELDVIIEDAISKHMSEYGNDDDYGKLTYLVEETSYSNHVADLIEHYFDELPKMIMNAIKTTKVGSKQEIAFRHKSNSWETAQKEMFEFWQQDYHFFILKNPNVPEYVFKNRIIADGADNSVDFFKSLIYNESVSEKIFVLHSRSFVEEAVFHVLATTFPFDVSIKNINIPEFLYLASFVNDVKKNNLDVTHYGMLQRTYEYAGLNSSKLSEVMHGMALGEIAFNEDLDKHVQMIFTLQEDLPETTVQKLCVSILPEVRQALAFAKHTSSKTLEQLSNDSDTLVRLLVALHESTDTSTLLKLIDDPDPDVRESAYLNLDLSIDEIEEMVEQGDLEMVRYLARHSNILPSRLIDLTEHEDEIVRFNAFSNENLPEIYRDLV